MRPTRDSECTQVQLTVTPSHEGALLGDQPEEAFLVGSYPLKKPDLGHLQGSPLSTLHNQAISQQSRTKPSLKPPRSLGSRAALNGWKGIVATEEENGGFGWKPGEMNATMEGSPGVVTRRPPIRRKSESNIPALPHDDGSLKSPNPETPVTVVEYLQSTAASSKTASYVASPRLHFDSDEENPMTEEKRQTVEATTEKIGDASMVKASKKFEKIMDIPIQEAQDIDRRDGRSVPQPHTSPVASVHPSCDESAASFATIKNKSKGNRNLEAFLTQTRVAFESTRGASRPRGAGTAPEEMERDDAHSLSLDSDQVSLTSIARLSTVELWEDELSNANNLGCSDMDTSILDDTDVASQLRESYEEPPRVIRARKRRTKAQLKKEAASKQTKSRRPRNKNKGGAMEAMDIKGNVVPIPQEFLTASRRIGSENVSYRHAPEGEKESRRSEKRMPRMTEKEVVCPEAVEARRAAEPSKTTDAYVAHQRRRRSFVASTPAADPNTHTKDTNDVQSKRERAFKIESNGDGYRRLNRVLSPTERHSPVTQADSHVTPSPDTGVTKLPKPSDAHPHRSLTPLHATKAKRINEDTPSKAPTSKFTPVNGSTHKGTSLSKRHSSDAFQDTASRIPLPGAAWKGDWTEAPPPGLEWSQDGVDRASRKILIWSLLCGVLIWLFTRQCALWKSFIRAPERVVSEAALSDVRSCPTYAPLISCGIPLDVMKQPKEETLCPSLLEVYLGYQKCPSFLTVESLTPVSDNVVVQSVGVLTIPWVTMGVGLIGVLLLNGIWLWVSQKSNGEPRATGNEPPRDARRRMPGIFRHPTPNRPMPVVSEGASHGIYPFHPSTPSTPSQSGVSMRHQRPVTPEATYDDPRSSVRYASDGDMQVFALGDGSDAESIPESIHTVASSTTQRRPHTRAASRRAANRR